MTFDNLKQMECKPACQTKVYTIYSLINVNNGKRYIGRSTCLKNRLINHYQGIKNHIHKNKGILKDSYSCKFEYEVLEENVEFSRRKEREKYWILHFKTNDSRYGYNDHDQLFNKGNVKKGENGTTNL